MTVLEEATKAMEVLHLPSRKPTKPVFDDANGVVRSVRVQPPAHCILKVDSYPLVSSTLSKKGKDHFDSTKFCAGGCNWVLSVYPNGHKEDQGSNHLSLYVTLVDKLKANESLYVTLKFFVFDHIEHNYLCVLDLRETRFDMLNLAWGIPKFLPIDTLNDASNGFMYKERCVFGAEIAVIDLPTKICSLSVMEQNSSRKFTWRIEKLSKVKDSRLSSPVFDTEGRSWNLDVYPRGTLQGKGNSLSLFMCLNNHDDLVGGSKLYVDGRFFVKNQLKGADHQSSLGAWFTSHETSWGQRKFIALDDLHDKNRGFVVDDVIVVELTIKDIFVVKDI